MFAALFFSLVVIFFLCGIWIGGLFFELTLAVKFVLTLVLLGVVIVLLSLRYILNMRAGARLEKGMVAGGDAGPKATKADHSREITALQQQMKKSIAALKASRLAGGGRTALYALPWYAIIGPPGAGKTTAIRHSSLEFPFEQTGGASPFRGTSGTRNCDWWFTNEAILLDTAGRYSEGTDDQAEWFAFLDLLRRNRPRKPLNGLIVAISITDLVSASAEEIEAIGKRLRSRVDEITQRLKLRVPVYVLFTKTDMIAGFVEFWGDLRKSERGQLFGMGFTVDEPAEPGPRFEREFEMLLRTLRARTVRRLHIERHLTTRHALWAFPIEFATLQANLASFVSVLFKPNSFQETPIFRGVYFSSGTQNARPLSRVIAAMAQQLGFKLPATAGEPATPASFFLTDVFKRVMFRDSQLAGVTDGEARRSLLIRMAAGSFAVMVAGSILFPGILTWVRNRELLRGTVEVATQIRQVKWTPDSTIDKLAPSLDAAGRRLRQLSEWSSNGAPIQLRWGMYSGEELRAGLRDVYTTALTQAVLQPAKRDLEDRLRSIDMGPSRTTEHFNRDYDELKLYLMLGDPTHMDPAWAAPRLARQWDVTSHPRISGEEELATPHLLRVCEFLARGEIKPWDLDKVLVQRVRTTLSQVPQMDRLYESLVRDANTEIAPIQRAAIFYGTTVAPFIQARNDVKVAGAYTKPGWALVRSLLGQQREKLAAERWVLEDPNEAGDKAGGAIDKLRDLYFERYQAAWRDFFADLKVLDPGDTEHAVQELTALSEPEWPYLRLIRVLSDNVTIDIDDPDASKPVMEKLVEKGKEALDGGGLKAALGGARHISPMERAFKPILTFGMPAAGDNPPPTGLSQYESTLNKLVAALSDQQGSDEADPRKLGEVFQDALRGTSELLSRQDAFTRPLLQPLLNDPINYSYRKVVHDTGAQKDASWDDEVWEKWHSRLEGKYPFAVSPTDASLDDVLDFFEPGQGQLWSFFDASLRTTIDRVGGSFVPARRFRAGVAYTSEFLDGCLKRGWMFTTVLYPPHHDKPAVTFDVNLHSVSSTISQVTFEVDGVSHAYRNEPEQWVTITWPGKTPRGARLQVKGAGGLDEQISRQGDFGLLRLLDEATVTPGRAGGTSDGTPTLVASWELRAAKGGATVTLDIRPAREQNPISPGFFRGYTCPRTIIGK